MMPRRSSEQARIYAANKQAMYARDRWHCQSCNNTRGLTPHHIVTRGRCGGDELENLVTLCIRCHDAIHDGKLAIEQLAGRVRFERLKGWKP